MTVSATSSPVVLLTSVVEPAKAVPPVTANPSGDAGASEFQLLFAQIAGGGGPASGLVLLSDKMPIKSDAMTEEPVTEDGNTLPLLTEILPPASVVATPSGDNKIDGELPAHKDSDDKADQADQSDQTAQAVTLLVTPPVVPPTPVIPSGPASLPTTAGDAQAAALAVAPAISAVKSTGVVAEVTGEVSEVKGDAKDDAKHSAAAKAGDALAIAAATKTAPATTASAVDLTAMNAASGAAATTSAQGNRGNTDFSDLLKQLDAPAATAPSGSIDSARAVQQADRSYQQTTPATATVSIPVASDGWPDAVADKVMWFGANKITSAEIHLNPPDLGPIKVHISTQQDQATVYFTSQHASVREALDQALPRLRDMMGGQGIQLANAGVGGQGSSPQQQDYRGNSEGRSRSSAEGFFRDQDDGAEPIGISSVSSARLARSGIDAYA